MITGLSSIILAIIIIIFVIVIGGLIGRITRLTELLNSVCIFQVKLKLAIIASLTKVNDPNVMQVLTDIYDDVENYKTVDNFEQNILKAIKKTNEPS